MKEKNYELMKEFLTKKELEQIYGLKLSKVNNLMRTGCLKFYKIYREVRFKKTEVDQFFQQHKIL